jgi:hypothetical protein
LFSRYRSTTDRYAAAAQDVGVAPSNAVRGHQKAVPEIVRLMPRDSPTISLFGVKSLIPVKRTEFSARNPCVIKRMGIQDAAK